MAAPQHLQRPFPGCHLATSPLRSRSLTYNSEGFAQNVYISYISPIDVSIEVTVEMLRR